MFGFKIFALLAAEILFNAAKVFFMFKSCQVTQTVRWELLVYGYQVS